MLDTAKARTKLDERLQTVGLGGALQIELVVVPRLAWDDGTVRRLATAVYDERAFDRLPVLADALEEAGCTSQDVLSHCRGWGSQTRGCGALDLVLGKS